MKLKLSDDLYLPLDIIAMRVVEYGDSGSGKTAFARLLAEKIHESGHRFCAIDLKNDWWGLKSSADGQAAGIPVVIFGGPRADVKIFEDAAAAATLADTIGGIDQPVIIDLDSLSRAKQERFLTGFLDRFYEVNRRPIMLFCDEADRYAPQKPMTQDAILSLSSSEDIARRGRKRGIGSTWLTQRTAVLNKNVSEFGNLTIIFRTPGERDLKELEDRVGRIADKATVKEVMHLAPGLEDGEAFFLSSHPKLRAFMPSPVRPLQMPLPRTFDSSATPGVGHRRREPKILAHADLTAIEEKMASQIEKAKADDPKALRAEIARLKSEAAKAPANIPKAIPPKIIEKPVLKDSQITRLEKLADRIDKRFPILSSAFGSTFNDIAKLTSAMMSETASLRSAIKAPGKPLAIPTPEIVSRHDRLVANPPPRHQAGLIRAERIEGDDPRTPIADNDTLPIGERRILTACAQYPDGIGRDQATVLTGYKRSTRDAYIKRLKKREYILDSGISIQATSAGVTALGNFKPLPTGSELQTYWFGRLPEGERRILDVLVSNYPGAVEREAISVRTAYKRSTRDAYLKRMASKRIVEVISGGSVRASADLFD